MAKSETKDTAESTTATASAAPAPAAEKGKRFFLVKCNATTYLAHNPAVLELAEGENAWDKFMELNGISACEHGHETTEITAQEAADHRAAMAIAAKEAEEKKKIKRAL